MLRSEDVSKNMLLRSDDTILRVIDVRNDRVFLIDCIKRTMPEWADLSTVLCLEPCTEEDLWTETDVVIPEMQALTPEQLRLVHERFTMIAVVLPFVSDKKERIRMIDRISQNRSANRRSATICACIWHFRTWRYWPRNSTLRMIRCLRTKRTCDGPSTSSSIRGIRTA